MSQNVTNNWFQKLGTDSNFLDRQSSGKAVTKSGSTFQSFLSQQIKKSTPSSQSTKNELGSSVPRENTTIKKMDTTASKLAVRSPEKVTTSGSNEKVESKMDNDSNVQKVDQSTEKVKDSVNSKVENVEETTQNSEIQDEKDTIELSEVAPELLQMLQSLPEEVIQQLPEDMQTLLASLSEQLQSLTKSISTGESTENVKSQSNALTLDLNNKAASEPLLNEKLVETLKQVVEQLKATDKPSSEQTKTFGDILEQLKSEMSQGDTLKSNVSTQGNSESKVSQTNFDTSNPSTTTVSSTNNNNANGDVKSDLNDNTSNQNLGTEAKVVKETKVEVQNEAKSEGETLVHNFTAKAEASTIAFGKQEVTNQTVKNALHTNIMDQIINSPKLQIKQTEQGATMTLKLNPEVLGNVEIKMEIVKGVLQAEINVENMIVKGAIESSLADLKNALSDKGYQVETLNVSVGQEGRQSQQQQQQERKSNERASFTPEELEAINSSYDFDTVVNDTRIDYLG